jgi:biopolymer transport protein ExbD
MRIANDRRGDEFEINVVPLIDVLLTLFMFFALTSTFVQHARMQVTLPNASSEQAEGEQPALIITVDKDGRYFVGSDPVPGTNLDVLKQRVARVAGDDFSRTVMIRADAASTHQSVVTAMDALGQLGFTHLSMATTPTEVGNGR